MVIVTTRTISSTSYACTDYWAVNKITAQYIKAESGEISLRQECRLPRDAVNFHNT
jgi:hypothetical protein